MTTSKANELIDYLRRAINASVFGIPAEAIPELQAKLSELAQILQDNLTELHCNDTTIAELRARSTELEQIGSLDQHYADIVRTAMAFDEGGDFGALTAACARLRLAK